MIVDKEYSFGNNLRRIRMSRGHSQTSLGIGTGIPQNRISNWELGYANASYDDLRTLCEFLGCFPGDFLGIRSAELSIYEYDMINGLRDLDEQGREIMKEHLATVKKHHSKSDG